MEPTIYQESPLAQYLEGHGEANQAWQSAECNSTSQFSDVASFAPMGPPKPIFSQVEKLISTFKTHGHRRSRTMDTMRNVSAAVRSARASPSEDDRFLDQFRYSIIGSQLLIYDAKPQVEVEASSAEGANRNTPSHHPNSIFSLQGVYLTVASSFFVAWALHWLVSRPFRSVIGWRSAGALLVMLAIMVFGAYEYATRKASREVCQDAANALSDLITQCQALDAVARSAFTFIQEVEVVSRGYDINNPLPPISRLEQKGSDRRCHALRTRLASVLSSATHSYLDAHTALVPMVDATDMLKYHDVYELSREDYHTMIQGLASALQQDTESLRGLRATMMHLFMARQIFLCDLLALPSESSVPHSRRWSVVCEEIANVASIIRASATAIAQLINETDNVHGGAQLTTDFPEHSHGGQPGVSDLLSPATPGKEKAQAQLRRLDALSHSIRGLNAKMLLMRDEANILLEGSAECSNTGSTLARQYDSVGTDLKSLVSEWERGRKTMLLGIGAAERLSQSRSSSGPRSPQSPVHSLGGITAINDDSPSPAFGRLAEGSSSVGPGYDGTASDEEIFEAVSLPTKPKRLSMTREEKLVKMQEDRRKRATLQEHKDATTHMLRELETVIKHRPRGRTTSGVTSA